MVIEGQPNVRISSESFSVVTKSLRFFFLVALVPCDAIEPMLWVDAALFRFAAVPGEAFC